MTAPAETTTVGGIVLCGGHSPRMGMPKAWLQLGAEYLLQHMVRIVSAVVKPIVVAGRAEQNLPPFPGDVAIAHDIAPGLVSLRNVNDPDTLAQMRRDGKPPSP